ncbi:MAG: biliverdin-producing heme oxygenase [Desulfonatronovibrionaceae bacterium]
MNNISLVSRLRQATQDLHSQIEQTSFAGVFFSRTVSLKAYLGYIRVLGVIHSVLEKSLDQSKHPLVQRVWNDDLRRFPLLIQDNDQFRYDLVPDVVPAINSALKAASLIRVAALENPLSLLGFLYVMAGSSGGASVLAPLAAEALELEPHKGLAYLSLHGGKGVDHWQRAAEAIDRLPLAEDQVPVLEQAAESLFEQLLQAFRELWPIEEDDLDYTSAGLNPASGSHPLTNQRRDLKAVLRASDRTLVRYPYFMNRFGLLGKCFADSGGAWLAGLSLEAPEYMSAQINWLSRVLSSRGIPTLLLAEHMKFLAHELLMADAGNQAGATRLDNKALSLLYELDSTLSPETRRRATITGHGFPGYCWTEAVHLIASAAVDESKGMENSLDVLLEWLGNDSIFSKAWVKAVKDQAEAFKEVINRSG